MAREIHSVGVVGLGTMGAGIAEVVARTGRSVVGVEVDDLCVARGREHIEHSTERAVAGGKLDAGERAALLGRIRYTTDLRDLTDVDLVVEAIPESLELKASVFTELEQVCRPEVILASNTSSLSVTEIGVHTGRPGKVVGLHFFNPAPVLKLVEIVRTVVTEPDVVADVEEFARSLGKEPVVIGDRAGFIANALLFGYLNHAVSMYESRYATREDLDAAMRYGCGYPMGPLALLDLIGLDTAYEILDTMYKQGRDRLHAPTPIIKQMVTAGLKGR
ncbi:3-hydroxyacyl-CoA dehydrogenase family protein, partial [Actinophytocola sp.]|uniref:3-hydroxyacyl-CoA dehydrogenase family protein n=1 Tax=Actinophytocola sp. TaxID=1872138 RepID=UPI003899ABF4